MPTQPKMPVAGEKPPVFVLPSSEGGEIDLAKLLGKHPVVLYFYPKADTPGCTTQACGFRDAMAGFKKARATVLGVSPDPIERVRKFAEKFHLNFPLLADADHAVSEHYGVWQEKSMYGRKYMGVARTTFLIGKNGVILHVFEKVKPADHEAQVLEHLSLE
jgi:thioredoxin-dependent peroxiredoxin